jgi:lysyl-tRNA synthetase class 2
MDLVERKRLGKTVYPIDEDLIEALKEGIPPVSGIAVGVDRLVMLAADAPSIADTLFFPAKEMFDL